MITKAAIETMVRSDMTNSSLRLQGLISCQRSVVGYRSFDIDMDQGSVSTPGTYRVGVGHGYARAADSRDRGR